MHSVNMPVDSYDPSEFGFHSFRHFFVSESFASGIPESNIRLWVGHSDSKVIALYRHIRDEIAKQNIRKIDFGTT